MALKNAFICYRRDDADGYAGRIYDRLNSRFPGRIFMDVTGIGPGADFTRVIQDRVGACHALIAVIGQEWLMKADEKSHRRLFRDDDYVRREIATALARNIPVIPVLVRGATMPSPDSLPPDLAQLSFRNAIEITDPDFDHDVGRLIQGLEYVFGEQRSASPPPTKTGRNNCLLVAIGLLLGGGGILLVIIIFAGLLASTGDTNPSPAPVYSPAPSQASSLPPVAEEIDFNPVGYWVYQIGNLPPGFIDFQENNIYRATSAESADIAGNWHYSPVEGKLTLIGAVEEDGTPNNAEITIERKSGDQFFGRIVIEGATSDFSIKPR